MLPVVVVAAGELELVVSIPDVVLGSVLAVPELVLVLPVGVEVLGSVLVVPELLLELELVESISDVVLDPVEPEK